ncbi:hypothetical protein [Aeromonas allosaccharophila]|uniref:hypothetical protein n=1 Tax=Aeromonas allosaccharophila TaxID=656 RepID=UPI003D258D18
MNIYGCLLSIGILGLPTFSMATDHDLSLIIHGASIHSDCSKGAGKKSKTCDFNGFNPGLGVAWGFLGDADTGILALRGGFYRDSLEKTAGYAGLFYRKEWFFTENFFAGIGLQAGYLNGSGVDGFAALPMVTLGYKSVALEVGYAPKVDWVPGGDHVAVTTFSLRWTL